MKTAMQELIDELKLIEGYPMSPLVLKMAEELLQKEKEQIITDYSNGFLYALGYKHQDKNIDYGVTMQSKAEADIYYNQTYNQTNVGNDGFEFDNSSTIPPPKTNNL
jgi:hypothetical protein